MKYCHPIIVQLLSKLFDIMLIYEYVPNGFGISMMVPVPKNSTSKSQASTDDYRGISINPIISKVFEMCLLKLFGKYLYTSNMQFGFKPKSGCNHARYAVRKTIEFFIERDATVNLCALDLKRAFDKMNKYALFIKLMQKCIQLFLLIC